MLSKEQHAHLGGLTKRLSKSLRSAHPLTKHRRSTCQLTRRQLMSCAGIAGGLAMGLKPSAQTLLPITPERAVFIYVHGGAIGSNWRTDCGAGQYTPPSPFKNFWHRCSFFENTEIQNPGRSAVRDKLAGFSTGVRDNSLDTRIANQLKLTTHESQLNQLRLLATSFDRSQYSPTRENGLQLDTSFYTTDPSQIWAQLDEGAKLVASARSDIVAKVSQELAVPQDSFDWRSDRMLELTTLAFQSNQSSVATIMLGDADGAILPPPGLGLREDIEWRDYGIHLPDVDAGLVFQNYLNSKVVYLLNLLATTPDRWGRPLLDTTLVFQFTNIGDNYTGVNYGGNYFISGADAAFFHGKPQPKGLADYELLNLIAHTFNLSAQVPEFDFPSESSALV